MNRLRLIILFCCFLGYCAGIQGQEFPYIRHFTPADYGGKNQNWALTQDASGQFYAGNNGGLLHFDGSLWRHYDLPEQQIVRAVAAGKEGMVFCGGFAEFGYWKKDERGQLRYYSLSQLVQSDLLIKEEIWHILVLPDFVLFQSFSTLYKYDYQKVSVIKPPNSIMFAQLVGNKILLPVIGKGIYELDAGNTFRFVSGSECLKDEIIQFLTPNGQGGIWAGTTNNGIFELQNAQCNPWKNPLNERFKRAQLNRALFLRSGGWAIGTILEGLFLLNGKGQLRQHLNREAGLQNNTVLALSEDQAGNLWVAMDSGIDYVQLNAALHFFSDQTGRIGTVYAAIALSKYWYLGTNHGVFCTERNTATSELNAGRSYQLINGTQGQVWQLQAFDQQLICGHNSGTFRIEGRQAIKISDVTGGWSTITIPGQSNYLLQSTYTGLVLFNKDATGRWQYLTRVEDFKEPLKEIQFDAQGNLWGVHPNRGLYRLRLSDDFKKVLEFQFFTRAEGLPTDFHLDLLDYKDKLYLYAKGQMLTLQVSGGKTIIEPAPHFSSAQKHLIVADSAHFMLDGGGIWLLNGEEKRRVSRSLNLVPDFEHIVPFPNKRYLFCLENGYALLDKEALTQMDEHQNKLKPTISGVKGGQDQYYPLNESLSCSYRENNLKFEFSIPYYECPPRYAWQLTGYSEQWSDWQSEPYKEFTNLPAGQYVFSVRSDVSDQQAHFELFIRQPWYKTWWMFLVYVMLLMLGLYGLELLNRKRLSKQRQRLEQEKKQALEHQRSEAEKEKLLLEVENQSRELSNAALNLIRKNEALLRLKDELLETKGDMGTARKMARHIDEHLEADHDWAIFEESFNRVHDDFFKRLLEEFPELSTGDLRLAAYLKMNLSSKEIAPLLNISIRGVENKRYRLRKKLGLSESDNLAEFILKY